MVKQAEHALTSYFHKLALDVTRPFALILNMVLALVFSFRFYQVHRLFFLLLAFRFWVISAFLSNRLPPEKAVLLHQRLFAYVSKFIPYFYHDASPLAPHLLRPVATFLELAGTVLSTWAVIDLGRRFGVAPAKRGAVCRTGAYRWLRHPIYTGYAMLEFASTLLNRANLPIFALSMSTLFIRSRMEDKVLGEA